MCVCVQVCHRACVSDQSCSEAATEPRPPGGGGREWSTVPHKNCSLHGRLRSLPGPYGVSLGFCIVLLCKNTYIHKCCQLRSQSLPSPPLSLALHSFPRLLARTFLHELHVYHSICVVCTGGDWEGLHVGGVERGSEKDPQEECRGRLPRRLSLHWLEKLSVL